MKNALILHGTDATSKDNWFLWLERQLKEKGYKVWVPNLPQADRPNSERYFEFIKKSNWKFSKDSILIGHSSGAVAILGILQKLSKDVKVDTCILVGSFKDDLGWDVLGELFDKPFDFKKIKKKAKRFIFVHSNDDPYCPLDHAEYLSRKLGGELRIIKGAKHFSIDPGGPRFRRLPIILEILEK